MKRQYELHILIINTILSLFCSMAVAGGPEGSGGSDYFRPVRAWFLSQDPTKVIKVCFDKTDSFGVSEQELSQMIMNSFKTWGNYIEIKRLTASLLPNSMRIISRITIQTKCDGDQDLKFYFGTDDMKVVKAKIQYYKPFGFAELDSDKLPQPHWSPGFVWIANAGSVFPEKQIPNWQVAKPALAALIDHEVGHIFGNGHVDDTVMTAHLADFLTVDTDAKTPLGYINYYNRIDSVVELIPCLECSVSYLAPRQFDGTPFIPSNDDLSNSFRILVGHDPLEPLSASFSGTYQQSEIVFKDGAGTYRFPIKILTRVAERKDSTRLFNGHGGKSFFSYGRTYYGEIKPVLGTSIPVSVNYNMDRKKVSVVPLGMEIDPKPFFVASP